MTFFEKIKQLDQDLFLFLNGLHHPLLDPVMSVISDRFIWIPFYAFLLFLIIHKLGPKTLLTVIPVVTLIILAADQLSVHLFKEMFKRYRPCHNLEIKEMIHLVNGCGGIYGFVSSHAANTFGLAVFLGNILNKKIKFFLPLILLWALIVSYSRIYLGVHYPADIVAGGLFGALIGYSGFFVFSVIMSNKSFNRKT